MSASVGRDRRKNRAKRYPGENGWLGQGWVFQCRLPPATGLCGRSRRRAQQGAGYPVSRLPPGAGTEPRPTPEPAGPVRARTAARCRASAQRRVPAGLRRPSSIVADLLQRPGPAGAGGERVRGPGGARLLRPGRFPAPGRSFRQATKSARPGGSGPNPAVRRRQGLCCAPCELAGGERGARGCGFAAANRFAQALPAPQNRTGTCVFPSAVP